jgi:hypothetical protein
MGVYFSTKHSESGILIYGIDILLLSIEFSKVKHVRRSFEKYTCWLFFGFFGFLSLFGFDIQKSSITGKAM